MALKTVLEIPIQDSAFQRFRADYDKYRRALANEPEVWRRINSNIDRTRKTWDKVVGQMVAQNVQSKLMAKAQDEADRRTRTMADRWKDIARSTATVASRIKDATTSLLKWSSITGLVSGLLGAGGLFGIERLALGAAGQRRSALGLGATVGGQNAFRVNFGRLVDPDSFLHSVAGAKMDVQQRVGLIGAGLSPQEMAGDTNSTAVALLRHLKQIADQTNPAMLAQVIASRRLDQFVSAEDMMRLRSTSGAEFDQLLGGYRRDQPGMALDPDTARKWQDFTTQMSRAGTQIETTFIKGLSPLAPALTKLSESFSSMIGTLLATPKLKEWITDVGTALETFAKNVGTDEFLEKVKEFAHDFVVVADAVSGAVKKVAGWVSGPSAEETQQIDRGRASREGEPASSLSLFERMRMGPVNNPGNLRLPGSNFGFQQFASPDAGVRKMAWQLRTFQERDKLDTLSSIISRYAPKSENDTAAYIKDVAQKTGFGATQHLDLRDSDTMSKVIAAMISHEQSRGSYDKYKDQKVVVQILNNTGGNATVSVNGLKTE